MATRAHRAVSRRVVVTVLVAVALATLALVAFVGPAVGAGSAHSGATNAKQAGSTVFPREVRVADLADATLRETALRSHPPVTVLVELAPGVYANRGSGSLGSIDDYTAVFGRCADVNRYAQTHVVARACY